jgi:SanA protein
MMGFVKRVFRISVCLLILFLIFLFSLNIIIHNDSKKRIFNSPDDLPRNKVGLLLGTSKYLSKGVINKYYANRIDAAVELFNLGLIDIILVSGDNTIKYYNEPITIKNDLLKRGIPDSKIYLDFAGIRTLDSVVRSKEIFGQMSITVISQQFHVERALFIAKRRNIEAIGFLAEDVPFLYGLKTRIREHFARVKMVMDLIVGKEPRHLGEKVEIK